jgi:hypothetical protein
MQVKFAIELVIALVDYPTVKLVVYGFLSLTGKTLKKATYD